MAPLVLVLLGLVAGSFCSAWLHRIRHGGSVARGRSACPSCGHTLSWRDLVPILSWVALRGRCRYCHAPISWQYPALELVAATLLLLGVSGAAPLHGLALAVYVATTVLLLAAAVYDLRWMELPDTFSGWLVVVGSANAIALALRVTAGDWWQPLVSAATGGAALAAFFGAQHLLSRGKWIGSGDIIFGAAVGFVLGWPLALLALVLAYVAGATVALALLATRRQRWGSQIAFGPFLALGSWLALRWGTQIAMWLGW